MRHLARDPYFIPEPGERPLAHVSFSQKLQRDHLVEDQVVRAVHLSHPAFAQQTENAIPPRKHRACGKPPLLDTCGRSWLPQIGRFRLGFRLMEASFAGRADLPSLVNLTEALWTP